MIVSLSYLVIGACMGWTAGFSGYLLYKHRDNLTDFVRMTTTTQSMMLGGLAATLFAQVLIPNSLIHAWLAASCAFFWLIIITDIDRRLKRHINAG